MALVIQLAAAVVTFCCYFDFSGGGLRIYSFINDAPSFYPAIFLEHIDTLSMLWLVGVMVLFGRMSVGLLYIQSLRKGISDIAEPHIKALYSSLKSKLNIRKEVLLGESGKVSVPMTVGWLKPLVILPIGLVTRLDIKQVEAILAHELAHVKRHDYLVNILQSVIEILFFYHPLVWIISGKIRVERENCCDDLALSLCGNDKLVLAKALTAVADYGLQPSYAMAFGAKPHSLKNRIKRLLGVYPRRSFTLLNWLVMALVLILTGYVYAYPEKTATEKLAYQVEVPGVLKQDTLPVPRPAPTPVARKVFEEIRNHRNVTHTPLEVHLPVRPPAPVPQVLSKPEIMVSLITSVTPVKSTFTSEFKSRKFKRHLKDLMDLQEKDHLFIHVNPEGKLLSDLAYREDERVETLFAYLNKTQPSLMLEDGDELTLWESGKKITLMVISPVQKERRYKNFPGIEKYSLKTKQFIAALMESELVSPTGEVKLEWRKKSSRQNGEILDNSTHEELSRLVEQYFSAKRITLTLRNGKMHKMAVDV